MSTCPTCNQEIEIFPDSFGHRVQIKRSSLGWTRRELANALGYERTTMITRWETGTATPSDIGVVESIAIVLDVTPAWLLYGAIEPSLFEDEEVRGEFPPDVELEADEVEGIEVVLQADVPIEEFFTDEEDTETSGRARPEVLNRMRGELS